MSNRFVYLLLSRAVVGAILFGLSEPAKGDEPVEAPRPVVRVTVAEARRQAELMHTTLHATLQLVHHRYYREDEGLPIPAAVVDEVFTEIAAEQSVKLRWLVVEGQAMNTDHQAQDDFERAAVAALKADQPAYEEITTDTYRRAAAITLSNHCLKCHLPDRKSTEDRTAGLTISIPILPE